MQATQPTQSNPGVKALYIIVNAGFADEVMELARESGIKGATIMSARGESAKHESFMGITVDSPKEIILCITDTETAEKTMLHIKERAGIKTPAHSICFTMPVDMMTGFFVGKEDDKADKSD